MTEAERDAAIADVLESLEYLEPHRVVAREAAHARLRWLRDQRVDG